MKAKEIAMGHSSSPSRAIVRTSLALTAVLLLGAATITAHGDGFSGFLLGGTAQHALDPENSSNDVVKINTSLALGQCAPPLFLNCPFGTVSRTVNTRIAKLDNMIEFKAFFVPPKTCIGGSPRIQLAIDLDGDGQSNGNAHGNFGPGPFGTGCPPALVWHYEDLTDVAPRWDVTQLLGAGEIDPLDLGAVNPFLVPWPLLESLVGTFPHHMVCTVALVDDTFGAPGMSGIAYYDLFSAGRDTWVDRDDTAGRGFAMGCGEVDHDDDHHNGDEDHDHDYDDDDLEDKHRRNHRY
jgi:hypothetical protein